MSRLWKKKDQIYVFDQNTLILSNKIESLMFKLQSSIGIPLKISNVVDVYIKKIEEIINILDEYNIDYYSSDFTLDVIILDKLEKEINICEKELIKAINKLRHPIYKTFSKSNFVWYIIKNNINNYDKHLEVIANYDFLSDIENIINYKYNGKISYYLEETKLNDKKFLTNIGKCELINIINNN